MRNKRGQFMTSVPNPLAKSANPADPTRGLNRFDPTAKLPAVRMTHAVVLDLGDERAVLSLHPNVDAARAEAKRSMFVDAQVIAV